NSSWPGSRSARSAPRPRWVPASTARRWRPSSASGWPASGGQRSWSVIVSSLIARIMSLLALIAGAVAALFGWRARRAQARADHAQRRAESAEAALEARMRAERALHETRERQAAAHREPDTERRDDLEGGW